MNTWEAWLTIAVACGLLAGLALRIAANELVALTCLAVLVVAQELTGTALLPSPADAIAGFGNAAVITIALLFAVVTGLELTGGTHLATGWLLGGAKSLRGAQVRTLFPVTVVSGFLNNTPVVAALLPVMDDLAKRIGVSSSRLYLPLSYAAILGGMCTVMGTSTNLIVRTMYFEESGKVLGFFEPACVGIPASLAGLIYILIASPKLLPERKPAISVSDDPQQYTVEMLIEPNGPLVGKTIEEAGLRHLSGLYIAEIQRADGTIAAAKPSETLRADDSLILVGALDTVVDLRKIRGLLSPDDQARKLQVPAWRRTLVEAVVSPRCSLLGKTIREGRFRSHFGAAAVAIARGGRRLQGKIGDVRLEVGDILLLEASPSFLHRQRESRDFYLISAVEKGSVRRHERAWVSVTIMAVMVLIAASGVLSILTAALLAAVATVAFRCCTTGEARRSVDWSLLIVIGSAIGIGSAMTTSGAAKGLAGGLLGLVGEGPSSPFLALAAVYLATMICTEFITNNAAAILMFGIGVNAAKTLGVSETPFVIAVMIAASASFVTPFGYQTNLMVYGLGGYRVSDYLRFGFPLSLIVMVISLLVIPLVWPLNVRQAF
ncbi:SLC13 family permease [Stieleria varia]|uniref:Sodium-dependent dicarboxylate transporter SdcS n=1 Tax=Stieleria varia TaxID=2528005 RepID=A0A5C6A5E7_9BACT|nr:SLC13 family permease [Stieleria varia]TWT94528.1 Sodium-dependent dicarboxylate transporter SdcS [Stieleria varia]